MIKCVLTLKVRKRLFRISSVIFIITAFIIVFIRPVISYAKNSLISSNTLNTSPSETPGSFLYDSYSTGINDVKSYPYFFTKKSNRDYIVGFASALGVSFIIDRWARIYALKHQSDTATNIANAVHPFGSLYYMVPAVSALAIYGYSSQNRRLTNASLTSIESLLFAGVITEGLKIGIGRERPNAANNPFNFKPFNMSNTYKSFPSGDATVAWSMITPYAVYYNAPYLYAIPVAVDLERVYRNEHWVSDTVMGSFIGFGIGYFFSKNHINKNLTVGTNGSDITLSIKF